MPRFTVFTHIKVFIIEMGGGYSIHGRNKIAIQHFGL